MNNFKHGPYPLQITDGLDFYKSTMSQVAHDKQPDTNVTFAFKNRGTERLLDYIDIDTIKARFDVIMKHGFSESEISYLASIPKDSGGQLFSDEYLKSVTNKDLPTVEVTKNPETNDIEITTTGNWEMVTFWETIILSEVNEAYFEGYVQKNNLDIFELYSEGDKRLSDKIIKLSQVSDIKFVDFGTRRHFSYRWQRHVLERLAKELPKQLIGTSNIGLAKELGIKPIGTFAHEMPMVYAAIADARGNNIRASHGKMLDDWFDIYSEQLSIALTDTFGSNFFFADFGSERAVAWKGVRHDSGDPFAFGENVINYYKHHGIDPSSKTIVFSDGLDIDEIIALYKHFSRQINVVFGWGTTLTNDLGLKPLNIVMKAVSANDTETVKLSDVPTKHTGSPEKIAKYENYEFAVFS